MRQIFELHDFKLTIPNSRVDSRDRLSNLWRLVSNFVAEPILCLSISCNRRLHQHNVGSTFPLSYSPTETLRLSIALYGLVVFYGLTKDELKGRRPLAKFLAIKLIVFLTFYQAFVVSYESDRDGIRPQILS